ncbi:MAG: ABC transporter ATP-binding protein [Anaerolineales bacterium]
MTRIARFIKPYWLLILGAILLLFIQANADLALPDYMSRIVNNGIQQGGVENAVPLALRKSTFDKINLFLTKEEQSSVASAYTLIDSNSPDYQTYLSQYPALAKEAIYVLKTSDQNQIKNLNPIMSRGLLTVSFFDRILANPAQAQAMGKGLGFDLSKIPPNFYQVFANMSVEQRAPIIQAIQARFNSMGESMITQMSIAAVKAEYSALGVNTTSLQNGYILKTGGLMLLITLISVTATILVGFLAARVAAGFARDLRKAFFVRVSEFSNAEMEKFSTASLITRSTNDITQIQMVTMMMMRMVFYAPIIGIGGLIRAINTAASMWWIVALMILVLIGIIMTVFSLTLPRFKRIQTLLDRLNRVVRENLEGMMVVRAFNRQDFEEERFDQANVDLTRTMLFVSRVMVIMMPLMMFLMSGVSILVIWVGAHQVAQSSLQVGSMMAFMQYTMQIFFAFMFMSMMFIILPRASISADRIADVIETEPSIKDPLEPKHFPEPFQGVVEFREVCFRYPDAEENVLEDINLKACPGQTTAFIGTTGSGKSTIVNLIPRFYDVTCGVITIDGIDIREVTQQELRSKIGYVPQKSNLFSGTIESNLLYGDENATEEELRMAAEIAQAAEFIDNHPDGLQAEIAQGGTNVSGGQRQRLAIARALVKKAPIYIFDESFSALDYKTDAALRKALKKYVAQSTIFIVTQRVATIKDADQIIVLDEGRIVGKGKHQELMETCEVYRNIAFSQLTQEELA